MISFLFHEKKKQHHILLIHTMMEKQHTSVAKETVKADVLQSTWDLT